MTRKTYEMMARGDSIGVFQFESEGMRETLRRVRPSELEHLIALNALYRPGPMEKIPNYTRGKHNPDSVTYSDERLRPILESTNGVIVYQEQAMQIAKEIAGFRGAKADDLRKAIGKKNREAMAKLKPEFFAGCRASGTSEVVIEQLWTTNERSADYSFNKSHSACYALIAYRTAWLKANYPAEYMAALISSVMDTKDKVPFFVSQAEQMGISILPPDVNLSDHEFVVVEGTSGSGWTRSRASATRPSRRSRRPGRRGDPSGPVGLLCPGGRPLGQQEGDRGADQMRGLRLHGRHPQGDAGGAGAGPGRRSEGPAGRDHRTGLDLRWARDGPRSRLRLGSAAQPRSDPREEFERAELLAAEKESIGLFVSEHPLKEVGSA